MANPAPTINQINAFNATQGTTIDFNIIGGTELVRSNRIYIYDLSDNSLICTHLYISTESIHELPANTDSSIVYESGKSSADFVNGAQYYAQIQTYTNTAGTEGGSGLSVAKTFWCLVDPTLTITTIPSTISTTSYNVSATYNANTSVVSNIIQQYQFNLYSATGSLLQSSGVVVGSGTQQGTSDAYDISYNFTGLNVGSSYYVTVNVTTTQGMNVTTQSNTFTVSIDTPTLGEATVVNNACDGYISVTSNLSGEYGGSASGEIASFVTDSVNNVSSLKVSLDPIQDLNGYDKPWVGGAGKNKLKINAEIKIVSGVTFTTNSDGSVRVQGTTTADNVFFNLNYVNSSTLSVPVGTWKISCKGGSIDGVRLQASAPHYVGQSFAEAFTSITVPSDATSSWVRLQIQSSGTTVDTTVYPMICESTETDTSFAPYENICPITGFTGCEVNASGKNLYGGTYLNYWYLPLPQGTTVRVRSDTTTKIECCRADKTAIDYWTLQESNGYKKEFTLNEDTAYFRFYHSNSANCQITLANESWDYEPFGNTYTTALGRTVYGGTLDVVSGVLTVDRAMVTLNGSETWTASNGTATACMRVQTSANVGFKPNTSNASLVGDISSAFVEVTPNQTWDGTIGFSVSTDANPYLHFCQTGQKNMSVEAWKTYLASNPIQVVGLLATPQTYQLTPQQIQTLIGQNNVWSDAGDVAVTYNIPITNLLVKRQDVADVSGTWLTLHSQPVTQASDMDFTFIDFTNQYGKTYKYALVPLLTQTQSGVEVEVEGGYTVSDEVQSIFDGVFIADQTGLQKCKANVGYGNVDMNQTVGTITPIGAKYPVVITNSKNQYHNGSISGTIVPDDYYFNGNLSRIDMVNKRNELEQFLTNKRAKIIKDWNSNIWLVMIMDNVSCSFNNNYGMGMVNFSTNWIEVGDPTNQQDLQATGLIDVGGA